MTVERSPIHRWTPRPGSWWTVIGLQVIIIATDLLVTGPVILSRLVELAPTRWGTFPWEYHVTTIATVARPAVHASVVVLLVRKRPASVHIGLPAQTWSMAAMMILAGSIPAVLHSMIAAGLSALIFTWWLFRNTL